MGAKKPEPAASSVTASSAVVPCRLPVPPPFTNSRSASSDTAATTAARRERISRAERDWSHSIARPLEAFAGRAVAEPGDVALIGHQADQAQPGP